MIETQVVGGSYSSKNYHGFDFTSLNNLNYLAPVPSTNSVTGSNKDFYLGNVSQSSGANFPSVLSPYTGSIQNVLDAGTIGSNISLTTRKFMVPLQGGFDGDDPAITKKTGANITPGNLFGMDCIIIWISDTMYKL